MKNPIQIFRLHIGMKCTLIYIQRFTSCISKQDFTIVRIIPNMLIVQMDKIIYGQKGRTDIL